MQAPTVCPALCKHWPLGSGPGRFDPSPDTPPSFPTSPQAPRWLPSRRPTVLASLRNLLEDHLVPHSWLCDLEHVTLPLWASIASLCPK